jgi:hypothetical protein
MNDDERRQSFGVLCISAIRDERKRPEFAPRSVVRNERDFVDWTHGD